MVSGKIVLGSQGGLWKIASRELTDVCVDLLWNINHAMQKKDFESME